MLEVHIAYILFRFPSLTETFVAGEIDKLLKMGAHIKIYSLLSPVSKVLHPVSAELLPYVEYTPSIFSPKLWRAVFYFLRKNPAKLRGLFRTVISQPAPEISLYPKRVVIFLKAVWLAKELENTSVQLIHTHFAWLSAAASMVVSKLINRPFTLTAHAFDIYYSLKNDLLTLSTSEADRVVTISEYNKHAILEKNQLVASDQIEVIRCGIDLETFLSENQKSSKKRVEIISVGGLVEKKGHQILIPACAELASRGIDFRCTIVGEGPLRNTLEALIAENGMEDKVELAGARSQSWVRERLSVSDIFVLASVVMDEGGRDGIPVAIMEALAMGIPTVSTHVSGIPELVKDGVSGLLVPQKNIKALADALATLAENETLRRNFAENGRLVIEEDYDIDKNAAKLLDLFTKVIREQNNA